MSDDRVESGWHLSIGELARLLEVFATGGMMHLTGGQCYLREAAASSGVAGPAQDDGHPLIHGERPQPYNVRSTSRR